MIKSTTPHLSEGEILLLRESWIERLVAAAKASGAKIPPRKRAGTPEQEACQPAVKTAIKKRRTLASTPKTKPSSNPSAPSASAQDVVDLTAELSADEATPTPAGLAPPAPVPALSKPQVKRGHAPKAPEVRPDGSLLSWGYGRKLSAAEAAAQRAREREKEQAEAEAKARLEERRRHLEAAKAEQKKQEQREKAAERQRKCRANKVKKEMQAGKRNSQGKLLKKMVLGQDKAVAGLASAERAELSRPGKTMWKMKRNGVRGGVRQLRHSRMNWYHPYLWSLIDVIAPRTGWSAQKIVQQLQRQAPHLFATLNRGTVHKWFSKSGKGWSQATKRNVERRAALARSGRAGILNECPEIVEEVKSKLEALRASHVAVTVVVVRALMLAVIKEKKPELLTRFSCSEVGATRRVRDILRVLTSS
ncbi:hypothetical protein PsYK624_144330 [Phanerochaete sordida]|uniref:Uncharacterized protein n=1 Tax=Phanerochaete sordida TaxID=48140 RepID=A0A9P3GRS0_9APHY|nr:hypothetical protein PsYK624_144330 [Phanerochaete sordida]